MIVSTWYTIVFQFLVLPSLDKRRILISGAVGPILTGFGSFNLFFDSLGDFIPPSNCQFFAFLSQFLAARFQRGLAHFTRLSILWQYLVPHSSDRGMFISGSVCPISKGYGSFNSVLDSFTVFSYTVHRHGRIITSGSMGPISTEFGLIKFVSILLKILVPYSTVSGYPHLELHWPDFNGKCFFRLIWKSSSDFLERVEHCCGTVP